VLLPCTHANDVVAEAVKAELRNVGDSNVLRESDDDNDDEEGNVSSFSGTAGFVAWRERLPRDGLVRSQRDDDGSFVVPPLCCAFFFGG
jgi:hypothetical protein